MENGDMLKEIRLDVKEVLKSQAKQSQWITDHILEHTSWLKSYISQTDDEKKRLSSYSVRIRTVELFIAGIIAIPSIIGFLYYIGVIKLFGR